MLAASSWTPLRSYDFRRLLGIIASTTLAEFLLESVVYVWIISATSEGSGTRSLFIGLYVLVSTVPRIAGGTLLGVYADAVGARRSLLIANCGRAACAVVFGVATWLSSDSNGFIAAFLLVFVSLCASLNQLFLASRAMFVQQIISSKDRPAAASLSMTILTALSIASAAFGPFMFEYAGLIPSLIVVTALFGVGTLLSFPLTSPGTSDNKTGLNTRKIGFIGALLEGWRVCWAVPSLRHILVGSVCYGIPLGVNNIALILLWVEIKQSSLSEYGVASALFGLGAMVGSALAPRIMRLLSMYRTYASSLVALGLSYCALAFISDRNMSFAMMFSAGLFFSLFSVTQSPILMDSAPPEMTGRIFSTTSSAASISALFAALITSAILSIPDSHTTLIPAAVCTGGVLTIVGGSLLAIRTQLRSDSKAIEPV